MPNKREALPMTAWAVIDPKGRVVGGDERVGIFWLERTAREEQRIYGDEGRVVPVVIKRK